MIAVSVASRLGAMGAWGGVVTNGSFMVWLWLLLEWLLWLLWLLWFTC